MSGNFTQVFALEENLYTDDSPIIIRLGGIYKDAQTGKVHIKLLMHNISGKTITYVKASVIPFDPMKNSLGDGLNIEYLDLAVSGGKKFGDDITFDLPNPSTSSFSIMINAVAFNDGTTWTSDAEWNKLSPDAPQMQAVLLEKYQYAVSLAHSENAEDIKKAIQIFESLGGYFDVRKHIWTWEHKLEEMKRTADEKVAKKKRKKKILIIIGAIVLALVCFLALKH